MVLVGIVDPADDLACAEDVVDVDAAACEMDHVGHIDLAFY